jgi:hypothetical protein
MAITLSWEAARRIVQDLRPFAWEKANVGNNA